MDSRPHSHTYSFLSVEGMPVSGGLVAQTANDGKFLSQGSPSAEDEGWMNLLKCGILADVLNPLASIEVSVLIRHPVHPFYQLKADIQTYYTGYPYPPSQHISIHETETPHLEDLFAIQDAGKAIAHLPSTLCQTISPASTQVWRHSQSTRAL
jgi:hypothetical protein